MLPIVFAAGLAGCAVSQSLPEKTLAIEGQTRMKSTYRVLPGKQVVHLRFKCSTCVRWAADVSLRFDGSGRAPITASLVQAKKIFTTSTPSDRCFEEDLDKPRPPSCSIVLGWAWDPPSVLQRVSAHDLDLVIDNQGPALDALLEVGVLNVTK